LLALSPSFLFLIIRISKRTEQTTRATYSTLSNRSTLRKMTKRDLFFFRLDANQAAVIIGLFETVS
jgi:hypothetical protein